MKILILEDETYRQDIFAKRLDGTDFTIVFTAEDCISLLEQQKWDILFLDHDLDIEQPIINPGTGYEVACWLESHPDYKPDSIVIHSLNPIGASKMLAALPGAILAPGCFLKLSVVDGKINISL
jgi:CheY-like chemotaxis protein